MNYQFHITSAAEHDIMQATNHIEFTRKNPDAAEHLLDAVAKQIGSLADLPQKFRLVDDPVLASLGIRFVIINQKETAEAVPVCYTHDSILISK